MLAAKTASVFSRSDQSVSVSCHRSTCHALRLTSATQAAAPSASNQHVPPELDAVVLRAVAPNPDARPQSAAALASELRGVVALIDAQGGAGDEADEGHVPSTSVGRVMRFAAIVLALAGIAWWFWQSRSGS